MAKELEVVKKPFQKIGYSQEQLEDLARCITDPIFFIEKFVRIQHPIMGAVPFELYDFQRELIINFQNHRFNIAMICRQAGKTTTAAAFILWKAMFQPDCTVLIVANTFKQALEIMDRIRFMYENVPDHIRAGVTEYNKATIAFDNGSKIVSRATTPSAGRGLSITLLMADEFAYTGAIGKDFWTSIQPTLSCVAGDTLVLTQDGFVEIEELHNGRYVGDYFEFDDLKTFGKDGIETVSHGYVSPHSDTLIIETRRGMRIECTPHHPLYAMVGAEIGMQRSDTLKVGDCLRVQYGMGVYGSQEAGSVEPNMDRVPRIVLKGTRECQAAFLDSLFDGWGTGRANVLRSSSRRFLSDVQLMLLNAGVVSTLEKISGQFVLRLSGCRGTIVVPKNSPLVLRIREIIRESGKPQAWFRRYGMRTPKGMITVSALSTLDRLISEHGLYLSVDNRRLLDELIGPFIWDPITKITPSTNRTYDFTVPGTHSFLQNGVLGSNTGGSCIITSTPKSDVDQFAEIWKGAIDSADEYGNPLPGGVGKNGFKAFSAIWRDIPGRDEEWAKPFRESLGAARFAQEFENSFITDDETLIDSIKLTRIKTVEPVFYTGTVRWFKEPVPNRAHVVALDPSLGTGNDFAAIQVFELPGMVQVAEWQHNKTDPRGQVRTLMQVLTSLRGMLIESPEQESEPEIFWTVENNTIGEAILQVIQDTGEERFPGSFISEKKKKGQVRRFRKGMNTDNRKKLSACARFKAMVEGDRLVIQSRELLKEMKNFIHIGSTVKAKPGEHDDLVMAALLCVRMLDRVAGYSTETEQFLRERLSEDEFHNDPLPVAF